MARCIACRQGFTWECESNCDKGSANTSSIDDASDKRSDNYPEDTEEVQTLDEEFQDRRPNQQDDATLADPQSTGRKRAAVMYPMDRNAACDWKLKKNVGGGPKPINGCINGLQQARHHGPDKNTLNNDKGNVHLICHTCHNRWHTANDEVYIFGIIQNPHSPVGASIEELAQNEMNWAGRKLVKAKD